MMMAPIKKDIEIGFAKYTEYNPVLYVHWSLRLLRDIDAVRTYCEIKNMIGYPLDDVIGLAQDIVNDSDGSARNIGERSIKHIVRARRKLLQKNEITHNYL
jgi:hypothetical protein